MIVEIVLFFVALYLVSLVFNGEKNLPPGPWQLPVVGNFIPATTLSQCVELQKKHGDVFRMRVGAVNFVYIADYKLAKETLSKIEVADRPKWEIFQLFEEEQKQEACSGVIMSNGFTWHQSRRFLLRHLRDLGMGKSVIEDIILREVECLVEDFKSLTKEPSPLPFSINICILNVIWQLVASHRYDFHDKEVKTCMKLVNDFQEGFIYMGIPVFFPFLRYIFPARFLDYVFRKEILTEANLKYTEMMQPFIDDHLAKLDPNNISDLMDEYLFEMKDKQKEEFAHFSNTDLLRTTFDLFVAGNDTTSNMVCWVLLYMAKKQHIQKKLQEEIDDTVARDRIPGLEHREKLAYLDATINEVQRCSSLVPLGVMRSTTTDIEINGMRIPKDFVVSSVAGISHMDPKYWKDPEEFDPSRFLDSNGKFVAQRDGFQPFGLGKRQCLGEAFARMELFLIIAALLQNFTFGPPEGGEIDLSPKTSPQMNFPKKKQNISIHIRE